MVRKIILERRPAALCCRTASRPLICCIEMSATIKSDSRFLGSLNQSASIVNRGDEVEVRLQNSLQGLGHNGMIFGKKDSRSVHSLPLTGTITLN